MSQQSNRGPEGSRNSGSGFDAGNHDGAQPGSPYGQERYQGGAPGYGGYQGYGQGQGGNRLVQPRPHVGPGQALKNWWGGLLKFSGRASRSEYWWVALFITVLPSIVVTVIAIVGLLATAESTTTHYSVDEYGYSAHATATPSAGFMVVFGILWLVLFLLGLSTLSLLARRLHDANFSALFILLLFVPAGSIVILVFTLLPGNPEGARFDGAESPRYGGPHGPSSYPQSPRG
ncbi:DUF805 domain-containing protein [Kocuria massiliensis]|uniref:DUF805 domain-containing protein n=1 Tax=Kocuria massiliensis TaxID=1926282 RepID=UPI0022B949F0|nr:DUF805 domain-containing protein [Kocuria massiliensis]